MTQRPAISVGANASYSPHYSLTHGMLRRRRMSDDQNSPFPIVEPKEWSALRISGIVLFVGTFLSHFLLLYFAHKLRRKTPPLSKVLNSKGAISERKVIDLDESYVSPIKIPKKVPNQYTEQCHSTYGGINVDSSSCSSSCSSHQDLPRKVAARDQKRTYSKLSSESSSSSSSADSYQTPKFQEPRYAMYRRAKRLSASSSLPSHATIIHEVKIPPSHQGSTMADTPITAKVTESDSSSSSSIQQKKPPFCSVAAEGWAKEHLPTSSSSSEDFHDLKPVQYPNLNVNGTVVSLTSICMGDGVEEEPRIELSDVREHAKDIPCTITTTSKKRRRSSICTRSESPSHEKKNSLQELFGRPRDDEIAEHRTWVVSVDQDDVESEAALHNGHHGTYSSSCWNQRQLLICPPTERYDPSAAIPLWVSNEDELVHHVVEDSYE